MNRKNALQIFGIIVLAVIGYALYGTSPKNIGVRAETAVTTEWNATEYVAAESIDQSQNPYAITLGVSKWNNKTYKGNTLVYEENWTADVPQTGSKAFEIYRDSTSSDPEIRLPSGYTKERLYSSWLINGGSLNLGSTAGKVIKFSFLPYIGNQGGVYKTGRQNFAAIGNSIDCRNTGNASCMYATGAYGFTITGGLGDGEQEKIDSFGALVPVKWTVTGKIY